MQPRNCTRVCARAQLAAHTQRDTPLEPTDRCTDTPERSPDLQRDAGSALWDSEKGMRVVPSHRPSLEVSGEMKVERQNGSMEGGEEERHTAPPSVTQLVLTFRLHQVLHNILLALVKWKLA